MKIKFSYKKLALFFLFLQLVIVIRNIYSSYSYFFWVCDFAPFIFFIGFLFKKEQLVKGLISIALIPQFIFLVGFISKTILYLFGYGIFDYSYFYIIITIFFHFASLFAISLSYGINIKRESLFYSFFLLIVIFFVTISFTSEQENINYIFEFYFLNYPILPFLWVPLNFLIVVVPSYCLQKIIYRNSDKIIKSIR